MEMVDSGHVGWTFSISDGKWGEREGAARNRGTGGGGGEKQSVFIPFDVTGHLQV